MNTSLVAVPDRVVRTMRSLTLAANNGLECPSNHDIAVAIGASSTATAVSCLALLESMNLIRVERGTNNRVVTIVATGKATAGTTNGAHWTDPRQPWNDAKDEILLDIISDGGTFHQAAVACGVNYEQARKRFRKLTGSTNGQ